MDVKEFLTSKLPELFLPPNDSIRRFPYNPGSHRLTLLRFHPANLLKGLPYVSGRITTVTLTGTRLNQIQLCEAKPYAGYQVLIAVSTPIETELFLDVDVDEIAKTVGDVITNRFEEYRIPTLPIVLREETSRHAIPQKRRRDLLDEFGERPLGTIWYHYREDERLDGFCEIFFK